MDQPPPPIPQHIQQQHNVIHQNIVADIHNYYSPLGRLLSIINNAIILILSCVVCSSSSCDYKVAGSLQILSSLITIVVSIIIIHYRSYGLTNLRKYLSKLSDILTIISIVLLFEKVHTCDSETSTPIALGVMEILLILGHLVLACCLVSFASMYFMVRYCFYTQGLNKKIMKGLPVYLYKGDGQEITTDQKQKTVLMTAQQNVCPICLSKYEVNDKIRLLIPPCSHHYHQKCIDEWFKLHTTCPTCRLDLDPTHNPPQPPQPPQENAVYIPPEYIDENTDMDITDMIV